MLHTINKSPFSSQVLDNAIPFIGENEVVLLYEDGVLGAMEGTVISSKIKSILAKNKVYALQADLKARGVDKLVAGVEIVDYDGFVDLTVEHKIVNWL